MKLILFFIISILHMSCAGIFLDNSTEQNYNSEFKKKEFFEEWGIFRYTGINVMTKDDFNLHDNEMKKMCKDIFRGEEAKAIFLYNNKENEMLSIECFYWEFAIHQSIDIAEDIIQDEKKNGIKVKKEDSLYKVLYEGDSIPLVSGNFINHKKVCEDTLTKKCSIDEDDVLYPKYVERIYEVDFPVGLPVISTTIRTKEKNLRGFKPLKLDPSLLPLESPGYKALREQEEAMNKE